MPFPLIPVIVGVSAFLIGLGAGTVARGEDGTTFDLSDVEGKKIKASLKSGGAREGLFNKIDDNWLTLGVGDDGEVMHVPLKSVKQVYVYV